MSLGIHDVFKILGNKNRVLMLMEISNKGGIASHSDLSYRMGLNPKSTKDHLSVFKKYGVIEKIEVGYSLTDSGKSLVSLLESFIIQISILESLRVRTSNKEKEKNDL